MDRLAVLDESNSGPATGRDAKTPLEMPARGWRQVTLRALRRSFADNIGLVGAGTAFYGFVAIVPTMISCVLIYSIVADPSHIVRSMRSLELLMPAEATRAIVKQMLRVVHASSNAKGAGIFVAIAIALFGARNAATALIAALNVAYGEKETRGFKRLSAVALAISISGIVLSLTIIVAIGWIADFGAALPGRSGPAGLAARFASYAVALALAAFGAAALYRYAPCRTKAKWSWIAPGSVFAAVAWAILTAAFSLYVERFGTFSVNYGPSAAGVVLLVWLYLSSIIFLFGAEVNAELEQQTERDTTEGAERPAGARGAAAADKVASSSEVEEGAFKSRTARRSRDRPNIRSGRGQEPPLAGQP